MSSWALLGEDVGAEARRWLDSTGPSKKTARDWQGAIVVASLEEGTLSLVDVHASKGSRAFVHEGRDVVVVVVVVVVHRIVLIFR